MNYTEIKDLSAKELAKKSKAATAELFTLKMKNSLGQLANPMEIKKLRREIAQIKTAISKNAVAPSAGKATKKVAKK